MTNGTPNFDKDGDIDSLAKMIEERFIPLIETASEEELSSNLYVTLPDGTHEFIPKKDISGRFDDPSIEYRNAEGKLVREHIGEGDEKLDIIGNQPHFEKEKRPRDFDPNQRELGL
jgi:hypothetical protein